VFCALEVSGRLRLENRLVLCIADVYSVMPDHSLVVTRRHVAGRLNLHPARMACGGGAAEAAVGAAKCPGPHDQRLGWFSTRKTLDDSSEAAGQTMSYAHWHLIPRP